uniref:Tubulin tyrosine ligase-like family, member 6 n=1 Tax=Stegastes partitus TaxID=144197 RepID=A0A3B4Z735_9TELE
PIIPIKPTWKHYTNTKIGLTQIKSELKLDIFNFFLTNRAIKTELSLTRLPVYISRPLIIDGYKFDLRIYVLVTSCDPLSIFMFKEGLARFCTTKYNEPTHGNVDDVCMHLTNYSINKNSENFVRDEDTGSKRKLHNTDKMWNDIEDVIIKTLISAHPVLKHNYHGCFPNHTTGSACFEILEQNYQPVYHHLKGILRIT